MGGSYHNISISLFNLDEVSILHWPKSLLEMSLRCYLEFSTILGCGFDFHLERLCGFFVSKILITKIPQKFPSFIYYVV